MTEEQVFQAALELADPADRTAYLNKACGRDAEFRRQVEELLAAHFKSGEFLDEPLGKQRGAGSSIPIDDNTVSVHTNLGADAVADEKQPDEGADDLHFLQPSARPDSLGRIGHYEVLEVLGKGGFGIVFRAFDDALQRVVAIKVLAPAIAATSPARKRFLREARSYAQVRHENVVQVYAVEEQPLPYLVMEFIPGESLQQRINRIGPLDVPDILHLGRQIAEGLAAAHATGLIHRDIKPANVLIEAGPPGRVKITDFGLARAADDASLTQSGVLAGTPMYMAPEQAKGEKLDHRADLFSLGSVLYAMATGRPPFRAATTFAVLKRVVEDDPRPIQEVIPEVPQWLCDIIARLQAKKPEDRFATAREAADLLGRRQAEMQRPGIVPILPDMPPPTAAKTPPSRKIPQAAPAMRRPRFRVRRWAAVAAVFVLLLGGLGFTEATGVTDVHGTVIRLFSPEGTLVVEVDDPAVSVKIEGSDVVITGAGAKEIRLKPGRYTVEASKDGKVVRQELVTVTTNGRQVVRVSQEAVTVPKTAAEKKDPDRRAAEYVLSIGGQVEVNDGKQEVIKAAADLPPEPFRLTGISFYFFGHVVDEDLAKLKDCSSHLTVVNLVGTQVTDAGLAHLDCKSLMHLDLRETQVSDAGLARFKDCKSLKFLGLRGNTKATDAGLACFKGCKNLSILDLQDYSQLTDAGLAHFEDSQDLSLAFLQNTQVSDAGLGCLKDHKNLGQVFLQGTKVTAAGIDRLAKALPKCKITWDGGVIDPMASLDPDRRAAEYVLSIGGTVMVNEQSQEIRAAADLPRESFRLTLVGLEKNKQVSDAGLANLKDCKDLTYLDLGGTPVSDVGLANFEGCKNLTFLSLWGTRIDDTGLANFRDCKNLTLLKLHITNVGDAGLAQFKDCKGLTHINLGGTQVTDKGLANFKDCKNLTVLHLWTTKVGDAGLANFKDCKNLTILNLCGTSVTDAGLANFKDCKNLQWLALIGVQVDDAGLAPFKDCTNLTTLDVQKTKVTAAGIDELKKTLPQCKIEWDGGVIEPKVGFAPFTDADVRRIAALPAAEQVEEVRKELMRRNPGFDGKVEHKVADGVVTELAFVPEQVTDISPVRALTKLRKLDVHGPGGDRVTLADLAPLKGLKLVELNIGENRVSDLTPLQGMPLEWLAVWTFRGTDLMPLKGMPLKWLNIGGGGQKLDLAPLVGAPLEFLCVNLTQTSDLTPLKDAPLTTLLCSNTPVSDLAPLRGRPLKHLQVFNTKVSDLSPLKGMPLAELECQGSGVTDLSPVKDLPLTKIECDFQPERDAKVLRAIETLETINDKPAEEFWKSVEQK